MDKQRQEWTDSHADSSIPQMHLTPLVLSKTHSESLMYSVDSLQITNL